MGSLVKSRFHSRLTNVGKLGNIEYVDTSTQGGLFPIYCAEDGSYVVGGGTPALHISTDDGHTWGSTLYTFNTTTHMQIGGALECGDGELLITIYYQGGFYTGMWKSTGWTTNRGSVTFREVLCPSGTQPIGPGNPAANWPASAGTPAGNPPVINYNNRFTSDFGLKRWNQYIIVNEYGQQANGSTISGARYAYLSSDHGDTWVQAWDFGFGAPAAPAGQHLHGAAIDPFQLNALGQPRLWVNHGDQGCHIRYSDDLGATWTLVPGSQIDGGVGGQPGSGQSTSVLPTPAAVYFGSDNARDGLARASRHWGPTVPYLDNAFYATLYKYGSPNDPLTTASWPGNLRYICGQWSQRAAGFPYLQGMYWGGLAGGGSPAHGRILGINPAGTQVYDVYTDPIDLTGVIYVMGPTANGKLLAVLTNDGRSTGYVDKPLTNPTMMRADFPQLP